MGGAGLPLLGGIAGVQGLGRRRGAVRSERGTFVKDERPNGEAPDEGLETSKLGIAPEIVEALARRRRCGEEEGLREERER